MYERENIEDYIRAARGSVACPAAGEQIVMLLKRAAPVLALLASFQNSSVPQIRFLLRGL